MDSNSARGGSTLRLLALIGLVAVACVVGGLAALALFADRSPPPPNPPSVVEKMREVARLETLQLRLHKKISFEPEPTPAGSMWGELSNWVRYSIDKPQGRAIVFADVDLGLDLQQLDADALRIDGRRVEVVLPALEAQVRLLPAETEFIGSNLDSAETAQLFDRARVAFHDEVMADARLRERARESAERAIRGLLVTVGFREVVFVERHAAPPAG